ncbi:redox-sensitive transcriptional activator SoxR [Vibrio gallicus]|uniref:redox-sensitive transcriptional activator SoxR n=1 Tax=Vibrio gallicus TaxID=190897 RepID=UPI0021C3BCD7|nr:redox-sensitive transcriptional activator SoxR [Vibrio gallicus]
MLSVGEVAKRSGIAVSAVHFYERKQLIISTRNQGNQRRFSRDVLRRIAVIKVAQQIGLSLEEIKAALDTLPKHKAPTAKQWQDISSIWQQSLQQKRELLDKLDSKLDHCIGCGCLSMSKCHLYNPQDEQGATHVGAALW